jgi:hypothetical protein
MMSKLSLFPMICTDHPLLGGAENILRNKAVVPISEMTVQTYWDAYFVTIPDIRKLNCIVSEICSTVAFFGGPSDLTVEDDKWHFRSSNWAKWGSSRRIGLNSVGCVLSMACDCLTGVFVSGSVTHFVTNGVQVILQRAIYVEDGIQMQRTMIHGDRGCINDQFLRICFSIIASVLFTVK